MTKYIWAAAGVVVFIILAVGAFGQVATQSGQSAAAIAAGNQPIQVGVLLPLTTNFAWWGEAVMNGIAVAQANGYAENFEFIPQDTQCTAKGAVSATQSLKALHPGMHIFIVGCDSDLKAMVPILNKDTDLAFMVGLSGADLYESDFPIINLAYRLEAEATAAAKFASEKLGIKTAGVITDNGVFGGTLASSFSAGLGGRTVVERLVYNEPDPGTAVLKVLQSKPDAIYLQNDIPTLSAILKKLNQMGYAGERIVYYGGHDQSLIDTAGQAAEGVYVPWVISGETNAMRDEFVTKFATAYGKDPFVTAYFVYDGLVMLEGANKECGGSARCIESYFYAKKDFSGTLGKVQYQPDGEVERRFYMQQIKDGHFVEVK